MRPEAQLSDPMNQDTFEYDRMLWEDFRRACALSPELWILGGKLSPDPSATEAPETGYSELVLVLISLCLT